MKKHFLSLIAAGLMLGGASQLHAMIYLETALLSLATGAVILRDSKNKIVQQKINAHKRRTLEAIGDNHAVASFVKKYSPPADLYKELVCNEEYIYNNKEEYNKKSNKWWIKGTRCAVSRIIFANRIRNYVKQKNYLTVSVPHKYIFLAGNEWILAADKIIVDENAAPMSLLQVQELTETAFEMAYTDFFGINILRDINGKTVFCDTEAGSFFPYPIAEIPLDCKTCILIKLNGMTEDAALWLDQYIKNLESQNMNARSEEEQKEFYRSLDDGIDVCPSEKFFTQHEDDLHAQRFPNYFKQPNNLQ